MGKHMRVIHYLNQFFAGEGGEKAAYAEVHVKPGAIGPGKAVEFALGHRGNVAATVVCGDNWFLENTSKAVEKIMTLIRPYNPDILIAGPAFEAGRYGIACGTICQEVQARLRIPAVTAMYKENTAVEIFKKTIYILSTEDSVKGMADAVSAMVNIAYKLATGEKIGTPAEEGYFPRGVITNKGTDTPASRRAVSLLLAKLRGEPFKSEVPLPKYDRVSPALGVKEISSRTIALITDGGLVPVGNPDKIETRKATKFGAYSITKLVSSGYEIAHIGYDASFVLQDLNRLVPIDILKEFEKQKLIGKLHDTIYSTSGGVCVLENVRKMGRDIGAQLKREGVSAVLLTST
jgi:glycine reductase